MLGRDAQATAGENARATPRIRVAPQTLQVCAHVRGMLVAQVTVLFQRLADDLFQLEWEFWIQPQGGLGSLVKNGPEYRC